MTATTLAAWAPATAWEALGAAFAFGIVGIILTLVGFKAFDLITPRMDVQRELTEKNNVAVAIVVAAVIVAVSLVVGRAITG